MRVNARKTERERMREERVSDWVRERGDHGPAQTQPDTCLELLQPLARGERGEKGG